MANDVLYSTTLVATSCGACGIPFGLPADFIAKRKDDGATFTCPNGHRIGWSEEARAEATRLRDRLAAAQAREDQLRASLASQRSMTSHERSRVRGLRGVITRVKKRVGNGVCPCCSRTFQNLARHMESKHPAYSGEVEHG